jgi:hypothetical protein
MSSSSRAFVVAAAALAAVGGGALVAAPGPARGAERVEQGLPSGGRLEIEGLAGRLVVTPAGSGSAIGLRLTGPDAAALGRVRVETGGGRVVRVDASGVGGRDGGTTTSVGSLTVIQQGGGQSSVRIGGDAVATGSGRGIGLEVSLPAGTALVVRGLTGEADLGDAATAGLDLEAVAASVRAGAVGGPARLALTGAGEIAVREVAGPSLRVEVTGAGDVRVDGGSVDELAAEMTGSGGLVFGGRAKRARLELTGASTARLARVDERPEVEAAGAAEVEVGNWR